MAALSRVASSRGIDSCLLTTFYTETKHRIEEHFPSVGVTAAKIHIVVISQRKTYILDRVIADQSTLNHNLSLTLIHRIRTHLKSVAAGEASDVDVKLNLFWKTRLQGYSGLRMDSTFGLNVCTVFRRSTDPKVFISSYKTFQRAAYGEILKVMDGAGLFIKEGEQ